MFVNLLEEFKAGEKEFAGAPPVSTVKSRAGMVTRFDEPMLMTYNRPTERILFNASRDVNPFSLVFESLWVLAGRRDVAPITYYTKRMAEYSDDGVNWYGAYGHRWREAAGGDQLNRAIELLKENNGSRRVLLAMWDPNKDLLKQTKEGKDYPCNTHAYLSIKNDALDLTICNRSNDTIWGLTGANYVVFSFVLEYLATRIGVKIGKYHHFSNDLHVYHNNYNPDEWLKEPADNIYNGDGYWKGVPLIKDPVTFDEELPRFVERFSGTLPVEKLADDWKEPFLADVAQPMLIAFACHKVRDYHGAFAGVAGIAADDWRLAAENWIRRRAENYERR